MKKSNILIGLLATASFAMMSFVVYNDYNTLVPASAFETSKDISDINDGEISTLSTLSVSGVVTAAQAFKATLSSSQITTLQQTYTTTLAKKWSNLPCGSGCRNGIQLSTLNTTQLAAAKAVMQAALGTASDAGYEIMNSILAADDYLNANGGGSGYSSGLYFISFLNEPSTTGAWMLQFGGHHMAFTISFNGGQVVGTTPEMLGVEPTSFTLSGTAYKPLATRRAVLKLMLAGLSTTELTSAKLSSTFSDCLMSPGESNGNTNTMPSTKQGLAISTLSSAKQTLVMNAIKAWTADMDSETETTLNTLYENGLSGTYIGWTGSGTSGDSSTFLNANTNYVRIDGPRVWIEFVCQSGVIFSSQIHYHSVWRDHVSDYGIDLTSTALPLQLISFSVTNNKDERVLNWTSADEKDMAKYIVERSVDAKEYSVINSVAAKNNAANSYSVVDAAVLDATTIYYRLKMVDNDGTYTYSRVVSVKKSNANNMSIYPNPTGNTLQIMLESTASNANLQIIAADGKTVMTKSGVSGQKLSFDISHLPKGTYLVAVYTGNGVLFKSKFVK
ncbi:MAG: DUF3500 domain-containing protein [Siphonobacter sp.]